MFFSYNGYDLDEYLLKWVYYYNIEMASDIYFRREKDVYDVPLMPAAMWVIKAEAIKDSGLFDPLFFMYKEDDDLWRRMKNHGWRAGMFPKAIAYHHTSKGNNFTIKKRIWHNYGLMILNLKNINTNFSKNLLAFFIDYFKRTFISIIFFNKSELYVLQYSFISVLIKLHIIYRHRVVCASKGAFLSDKYL
jgi:GT2 family glycosyltransferase